MSQAAKLWKISHLAMLKKPYVSDIDIERRRLLSIVGSIRLPCGLVSFARLSRLKGNVSETGAGKVCKL